MRKRLLDIDSQLRPEELIGEADVDISEAVYTAPVEILLIEPRTGSSLADLVIDLDLNKTTTGWDTISTGADTLDVTVFSKIDGTNFRHILSASQLTAVGNGTHETAGVRFNVGPVGAGGAVSVRVLVSAERDDIEIPYRLTYRGDRAPAVTAVAAV